MRTNVVVVGAGLSGLVTAAELGDRGKKVVIVDQEGPQNLGGQAHWSLGGLFMVNTPEQRRLGIKDSLDLATSDWMGSAQFDRPEDAFPRAWAQAYLDFAAGEMRPWLYDMGLRWFPVVGWAERGGSDAMGHGNSVPRFHITWGTGPGVLEPFIRRCHAHADAGLLTYLYRHQVDRLEMQSGAAVGVSGTQLAPDDAQQGGATNRTAIGEFRIDADAVIVASGGIGGNFDLIRKVWPTDRLGPAPDNMLSGVPAHVDGRMIDITTDAGGHAINRDRLWFYTEGVKNWDPIWPHHGIRILPGPSSMWFDARGNRFAPPAMPGFDTNGTFKAILETGFDYSWFVLTQKIIKKEFALSGSEQNPDLTSAKWSKVLKERILSGKSATGPVEAFKEHGADFVVADTLSDLVKGMNALTGQALVEADHLRKQIEARDAQVDNPFSKDPQITAIQAARHYLGDRLIRTAKPHRFLDPGNGPLIAVRLNLITRKTLGGLQTNLDSRLVDARGDRIAGLYAAGEAAGFGGGGYHGYNSLEGTFLGGCIFSGRAAGRNAG
ncbi:FAD-binding dehydrogenase [Dinoroseobacter sp. S76]|uniref:FAD-binding dehydrogenase n=1 Tax=Dinoroseobacter sp. S76 TaxID=3415124 RepID=UPI003C7EB8EA